jgi:hypothetical protein
MDTRIQCADHEQYEQLCIAVKKYFQSFADLTFSFTKRFPESRSE